MFVAKMSFLTDRVSDLNTFSDSDVPYFLTLFYSDCDRSQDVDVLYREFCDILSDGGHERPSLNQFIYFFNMLDASRDVVRTQSSVDAVRREIEISRSDGDDRRVRQLESLLRNHQNTLQEIRKMLLKFSNDGLNRQSRSSGVVESSDKITIQNLNILLKQSEEILDSSRMKDVSGGSDDS